MVNMYEQTLTAPLRYRFLHPTTYLLPPLGFLTGSSNWTGGKPNSWFTLAPAPSDKLHDKQICLSHKCADYTSRSWSWLLLFPNVINLKSWQLYSKYVPSMAISHHFHWHHLIISHYLDWITARASNWHITSTLHDT